MCEAAGIGSWLTWFLRILAWARYCSSLFVCESTGRWFLPSVSVGRQEEHPVCRKLNVGALALMVIWREFCSCTPVCTTPPPPSLAALVSGMVCYSFPFRLWHCWLGDRKPCVGCGVLRIDPLHFLAGCRTRRLNQVWFLFYILACVIIMVLWFIRTPFYVLLVFIAMCAVIWLFWLSYQYLPSDWLERFVCVPILLCFLGQLSHLPYCSWR